MFHSYFERKNDKILTVNIHFPNFINHLCPPAVYSESKNLYHIETSQMIDKGNHLIGFYLIQVFTARYFQADYSCTFTGIKKFLLVIIFSSVVSYWYCFVLLCCSV